MQIYCGVYREHPNRPVISIIHDTDTDSYYACNQFADFIRFSAVHVTGTEYELGVPANKVWSYLHEICELPDDVVAVIPVEEGVNAFTAEDLGIEYVDAVPTTPLVNRFIEDNPGVDEAVLRTLLYRILIARGLTSYSARFVACAGAPSGFKLLRDSIGVLLDKTGGRLPPNPKDYLDVFLEKYAWEFTPPVKDRVLTTVFKRDGSGTLKCSIGYKAP